LGVIKYSRNYIVIITPLEFIIVFSDEEEVEGKTG
jgi:hypothetical protein